ENARAFEADGGAAGVIVGAGGVVFYVEVVAVAGVIVSGNEHDAFGALGIGAAQDGVDIADGSGLLDAFGGRLGVGFDFDFEAAAAVFGVALQLGADPLARGTDAATGRDGSGVLCRKCGAGSEADQFLDVGAHAIGRGLRDGGCDSGIGDRRQTRGRTG